MQLRQLFLIALAGVAVAEHRGGMGMRGNKNNTEMRMEMRECAEIQHMTRLTELVNNSTKLAEWQTKHHLNATQVDKLKAKAAAEGERLRTLTSNSTLVNECATMRAERKIRSQCRKVKRLTKFVEFANNKTAMQEFQSSRSITAEEMDRFMERAKNATAKLNKLKSNATLMTECQGIKDGRGSTAQGAISEVSKSAAGRSVTVGGSLQVVCTSAFAVVLAGLLAGLQL